MWGCFFPFQEKSRRKGFQIFLCLLCFISAPVFGGAKMFGSFSNLYKKARPIARHCEGLCVHEERKMK